MHGVVTGVGGGIIRDVLAREIPMILRTEIYATACIVGGIVHATAHDTFHLPLENSAMMGDGGHPGNSSGGYSLASEAADVCPGR